MENKITGDPTPELNTVPEEPAIAFPETGKDEVSTENKAMEVHTHSHTPRKKWSHYFWEFLMLFLAVFCGFLAEYKLEHVIENQREEKLMHSLREDLQADELTLSNYINWRTAVNHDFDSLLLLLAQHDNNNNDYIIYQKAHASVLRFGLPDIYEGTIQQLKNAGGLRLVRQKEIINAINKHYLGITRLKSIYELELLLRVHLAESMADVLDASLAIRGTDAASYRLLATDRGKINSFMNNILAAKEINQRIINQLTATRESAGKLDLLVKAAYDFH